MDLPTTSPSNAPTLPIETLRTYLEGVSPGSAQDLHDVESGQYRAMEWLFDDPSYDGIGGEGDVDVGG